MFRTRACSAVPVSVRLGAVGLAAVLALGGCSGSWEPEAEAAEGSPSSVSPSGSASASESVSPTATATPTPTAAYKLATAEGPAENVPLPLMPELAKEESKEGLEAFAEYWYSLLNYGFETGDAEPLKDISGPDCVVCAKVYSILGNGYADEDWIVGGKVEVLQSHSEYSLTSKGFYQVLINIKQDTYEFRGPGTLLYLTEDGLKSGTVQMIEAAYVNGQWVADNAVTVKRAP